MQPSVRVLDLLLHKLRPKFFKLFAGHLCPQCFGVRAVAQCLVEYAHEAAMTSTSHPGLSPAAGYAWMTWVSSWMTMPKSSGWSVIHCASNSMRVPPVSAGTFSPRRNTRTISLGRVHSSVARNRQTMGYQSAHTFPASPAHCMRAGESAMLDMSRTMVVEVGLPAGSAASGAAWRR